MGNNPINMIDPDGMAPSKSEVITMKEFKNIFEGFSTLTQIETQFDQLEKMGQNNPFVKRNAFLYSERWGFIDLKHFSKSAAWTNEWFITVDMVLDKGEKVEFKQWSIYHPSAFSEEDLTSNLLGAYFADVFLSSEWATGESMGENLVIFFTMLEASENPKLDCQCTLFDIPKDHTNELKRNHTYLPQTSYKPLDREIDKSILEFLREHRGDGEVK